MITAANQYNQARQLQAISIIDIAKKAGFKTHWISEHPFSEVDTPLTVIINESDEIKYVEEGGHIVNALDSTMGKLDKTKNNLIILHLIGSHADYRQRIVGYKDGFTDAKIEEVGNYSQDKYKRFMNKILNPYDSTIKYTDGILKKIFELTARKNSFVDSFIYLADHGEDVFGEKFHNSADFSYPMVRIPFVMYFSDRYKERFKDDFHIMNSRKNNIFTTDLLYNTMLDIFKIESENFENGYSLLDANYKINESNALTMQKSPDEDTTYYTMTHKRYIKDDPLYIAKKNIEYLNKNYPNKVLSVDNDLIGKAYQSNSLGFIGSEFNVVLEKFTMGHYPDYEFKTTLDEYLNLSALQMQKKLWFDLKSPKGKDIGYSVEKFEELNKKYNLKDRAWIESWEDGLDEFSKNGWNTLYYIQGKQFSGQKDDQAYNIKTEERNNEYAKKIAVKVKTSKIKGVSFFYDDYEFVKKSLEPLLPKSITYHVFGLPYDYQVSNKDMTNTVKDSKVFNDKRVKTILLDGFGRFTYRPEI